MLSVYLAASLLTLLAYVDATNYAKRCPKGCACDLTSSDSHLSVDCAHVHPEVDLDQLSGQFDSMLSTDYLMEHLTSLNITYSPLTRVPSSVCQLLNLTSLNLYHNKLTHLPDNCINKLTKLVIFRAINNTIYGLQNGIFDGLQRLVNLDLSRNKIAFIGLRVFSNASDLTSLRLIKLDENQLTSLEPWCYYRCILGSESSPVNINLANNLIQNFTNELQFDFRCGMKAPFGYLDLYNNRIKHIMDLFHGWKIDIYQLFCLSNMRRDHSRMRIYLGGKYYDCDCVDYLIYKLTRIFPRNGRLKDVRCGGDNFYTVGGQHTFAVSIPLNQFVCKVSDRCPSGCQCVYRPENETLHVYCSAASFSSLLIELPLLPKSYVKYSLDFSNNKLLRRLEHRPYFDNTTIFDVSNCSLTEIAVDVWQDISKMKLVNFQVNMFHSFPKHAYTVNISTGLLLGGNPYQCSCENSWMIGWFQSLSHQISDSGNILCWSPSRMYGRSLLKSTEEDFCVDPVLHTLIITLSTVALIAVLLVATGLLLYKLRFQFYRKWKFHPLNRDECVGENMDYDVFLCCSSEDEDPHTDRILQLLESNGYHVYYHERDFGAGLITENISRAIERSKRTVCLYSENFLRR